MKSFYYFSIVFGVFILPGCKDNALADIENSPNIIYILADDLGYGELGVYGQEIIETPHIDALANGGMRFTQHYSGAPVCAPARCILLTGQHSGHAYVRGNDEWGERGKTWDYEKMFENPFLEGQRPLPDSIITIAEVLQREGYKTGAVGKWGLGAPTTEGVPNRQGFDFFYGYNCQRQAHTYYPMHLWKNEERDILDNKMVRPRSNFPVGGDPNDSTQYADFNLIDYAPTLMHKEAINFISENKDNPFFFYYASPIPHLPLQAPKKWVDYYRKKLGPEEPYVGNSYFPNQYPRASYAAMISYLDEQVGDLVSNLKKLGIYENTLIVFSSDNGPTYTGGADTPFFDSAKPFKTEYGWGKGFTHEGGIRVPMIASWPGHIQPNTVNDHISAFQDVFPTLCEVGGVQQPEHLDGISFLPTLLGEEQLTHEYLYWEFPEYNGQQAVRIGKWKGIRKNIKDNNLNIELYNLDIDIKEQSDVAEENPEIIKRMEAIMKDSHVPAEIDRFKMEALGDVKDSYLEALKRAGEISESIPSLTSGNGYFEIRNSTKTRTVPECEKGFSILQERLKITGGYELKKVTDQKNNTLDFIIDEALERNAYSMTVSKDRIIISANSETGFESAVIDLIKLMDDKINMNHEMHNPAWTIASLSIENHNS